ncbi:myosin-2 heavy chain [Hordeum vulgare]|nr:myosin-2 heavy chain [Hordeum vulgare]
MMPPMKGTSPLPFSTKNTYNLLVGSPDNDTSAALIWASCVQIKVHVFGRLLFQDRLNSKASLFCKTIDSDTIRAHFSAPYEDATHIFLLCPDSIVVCTALQLNAPSSIAEIWVIDTPLGQDDGTWTSVVLTILWNIWDFRNSMSFRDTRHLVHV